MLKTSVSIAISLFSLCLLMMSYTCIAKPSKSTVETTKIIVAANRSYLYLPKLQGKRVGLIVNQTSMLTNGNGQKLHLVDHLLANNIDVKVIFAPEHGFRGDHDAGAKVTNNIDSKTGLEIISLYGKTRKPPAKTLSKLDVLVFDIQDVGVRFYTYISTMHYAMQAALNADIEFMVLDRPNPNISLIDGPMLESKFSSFVGLDKIPLLHGMTVGELAKMIKGEGWLNNGKNSSFNSPEKKHLKLTVIPVANYTRDNEYILPIKPSPNLPNQNSIYLYPQLGFFEATAVSIGRGTAFPFQVIGHDKVKLGDFAFTPVSMKGAASNPKLMNKLLYGQYFQKEQHPKFTLKLFLDTYQKFKAKGINFIKNPQFLDKLAGNDKFRKALVAGKSFAQIKQSWQQDLMEFKQQRRPYLLYH